MHFELSVAEVSWNDDLQNFKIRPVPELLGGGGCTGAPVIARFDPTGLQQWELADGACKPGPGLCSSFEPPFSIVQAEHLLSQMEEFVDHSAVTVTGVVQFKRELVGGADCPVEGVSVVVKSDGRERTIHSDAHGRFNFSGTADQVVEVSVSHGASVCDPFKRAPAKSGQSCVVDGVPGCCEVAGETCFRNGNSGDDGKCLATGTATHSIAFKSECDPLADVVPHNEECFVGGQVSIAWCLYTD